MPKDQTAEQKRAAADAAKTTADTAKAAYDADTTNADLKQAAGAAAAEYQRLEGIAIAPSHDSKSDHKGPNGTTSKREKAEKRAELLLSEINKSRIAEGLKPLSIGEYTDTGNDDDAGQGGNEDANRPVTFADLQRIGIVKSAEQLVGDLQDADLRAAVEEELRFVSKDLPADQRYQKALSLASSSKNARVAQEAARVAGRSVQRHASGAGSVPPRSTDGDFKPTPLEEKYMKTMGLSKEDILKSRRDAGAMNFGTVQADKDEE